MEHPTSEHLREPFRLAMRRMASTVCIMTVGAADQPAHGMLVTSVSSLSMDPPSLLVCVNRSARLHPLLHSGDIFRLNVLHAQQQAVASHFEKSLAHERFAEEQWDMRAFGGPALREAQASIGCTVRERLSFATHTIFIGQVADVSTGSPDGHPLVYFSGSYQQMLPVQPFLPTRPSL